MAFVYNAEQASEVAKKAGTGAGIPSGYHKVKILGAYLKKTQGGNQVMDLHIKSKDGEANIFGICLDEKWKSGAKNYDYTMAMEFLAVAGMKTGATQETVRKFESGKETKCEIFTELTGKIVHVALQKKLDYVQKQDGSHAVETSRVIARTFDAENKSHAEILADKPAENYKKVSEDVKDFETKAYKAYKAGGQAQGGAQAGNDIDAELDAPTQTPVQTEQAPAGDAGLDDELF